MPGTGDHAGAPLPVGRFREGEQAGAVGERLISRHKQFRRIATRYEQRAANDKPLLTLATILL